jgi:hypothetical protein
MTEMLSGAGRSGAFDPGDYQSVPRATVATASSASVTRIGRYPRADLRASAKHFLRLSMMIIVDRRLAVSISI